MATSVLDAYALLAFFRGEEVGETVKDLLHAAAILDAPLHMTEVNYAELKYMLLKKHGPAAWRHAEALLQRLPLEFHPVGRLLADVAANFKSRFRISLADAFAAALTKEKSAELVTGDPEFQALEREIRIAWLK